jgi:3-hydroxyisobutyrate dehydrogenase-like beta-hydroxyacid dehydrogenase
VTVGIVSLGAMGSAIAHSLAASGVRVVATLAGRSERTARLAERAGAELLPELEDVVRESDVVHSIVPPESAMSVADDIASAATGVVHMPLLVELNAVAPATVRRIADATPFDVVDGSISGPPPWKADTTRIYLSGPRADEIARLPFDGVQTVVVGHEVGSASAVKMSTASVYKGSSALLLQALRAAQANGVLEHVLADLREGAPELVARIERRLAMAASKSERYVGEMQEISATQADAGLTPALFEAMADVYADLAKTPLAQRSSEELPAELVLEDLLEDLG